MDEVKKLPFATRLVVVDHTGAKPGRVLDMASVDIYISFQDGNKTLKLFLVEPGAKEE